MVASSRPVNAMLFDLVGTLVSEVAMITGSRAALGLIADRLGVGPVADDVVLRWVRAVQASLGEQITALAGSPFSRYADLERVAYVRLVAPFVDDGLADFAVCSEAAGSCKPDGRIFEVALSLAGVGAAGTPDHTIAHLDELPGLIGIGAG